jgi:class 3 adenylate cyclase
VTDNDDRQHPKQQLDRRNGIAESRSRIMGAVDTGSVTRSQGDTIRAVVFVDVLGFAALTEQHELDGASILRSDRPLSFNSFEEIRRVQDNPLTRTFGDFHRSVKWSLDMANMRHPLTAITFSDSAFIATANLYQAARIAVDLVQSLLPQKIPVRIGIACGTFAAVRFRSDISSEGGEHAAHFLGTGVVRAYAAERCGIKGVRILLHTSTEEYLTDESRLAGDGTRHSQTAIHVLPCAADETSNWGGARYEIDYWSMRPTAEAAAWHALQDMWTDAAKDFHNHYHATAAAIDRMRVRKGAAPLANLRRRTLPRIKHSSPST